MTSSALQQRRQWPLPALALVMLLIVAVGYTLRIFIPGLYRPSIGSWIIRVHVIFVSLWLLTFATQVILAATGRLDLHRRIGPWAFRLGAVWVVTALAALAVLLHVEPGSEAESLILLSRIGLFALFLFLAWLQRHQPEEHKRWMILGMSQAIIGGIMRLPIPALQHQFPASALVALLFPLALILWDLSTTRRLYRATLIGSVIILIVHLTRVPLSQTAPWLAFAHWVGSWRL